MTRFEVFHHLDDPNDPIRHDTGGEKAVRAIIKRSLEWITGQDPVNQARYCEHGSYVGFDRSLAYLCPRCPES